LSDSNVISIIRLVYKEEKFFIIYLPNENFMKSIVVFTKNCLVPKMKVEIKMTPDENFYFSRCVRTLTYGHVNHMLMKPSCLITAVLLRVSQLLSRSSFQDRIIKNKFRLWRLFFFFLVRVSSDS
jgi:hypothetical protein